MTRPSVGGLIRATVAIVLTGVMLWQSEPRKVWAAAAGADLRLVGAAVALVLADRTLMAYRWLVLLRPVAGAGHLSLGAVMRIFFLSTFVGTFLPASVGGDAVRAVMLSREHVPAGASVASVFMDRMLGVLSVLLMAALGLVFARQLAGHPAILAALAVTFALCAVTALVVFSRPAAGMAGWVIDRIPSAIVTRVGRSLVDAIQIYATSHHELLNVLASSIGVQLLRIVQAWLLGLALGITAPITAYAAFIPLILLVMLLPITVNGLGTSQAAFVWFFAQVGVPSPPAFALSILFVALGIVGNLPGGVLYAVKGLGRSGQPLR